MFQSAVIEKALSARRATLPAHLDAGFRLRRPRESGVRRLLSLAAAIVGLAAVLGSVTVSAETQKAPQPVARQTAPVDAPQPRRAVRIIQIYNLPAR